MPILKLLSNIYGSAIKRMNKRFDNGDIELVRTKAKVISIGNLSVGGTGKTPFIKFLANELLKNDKKIAIIGKGYKGKTQDGIVISDGLNILCNDPKITGDEMLMLAQSIKVPVIAHQQKHIAAKIADEMFNPEFILLDDGFQHRKLHRNLDIVLIDDNTLNKPYLIPKGILREPLSSLKRADIICITDNLINENNLPKDTISYKLIIRTNLISDNLISLTGKPEIDVKKIIAFSAIANPSKFEKTLIDCGFIIQSHFKYYDHHYYTERDIRRIIDYSLKNSITEVITTEKDAVKLNHFSPIFSSNQINLMVLPIRMEVTYNKDIFLEKIHNL